MEDAAVDAFLSEADDARAGLRGALAEELVAFVLDTVGDAVTQGLHNGGDVFDADAVQILESGFQAEAADGVQCAWLIAAGVGTESQVAGPVVGVAGNVGPAEFDGFDLVLNGGLDVEYAAALGTREPLVTISGEGLDVGFADVDGKSAKALYRVDEEKDSAASADFANGFEVAAITGQELDEADGEQAGACGGAVDFLETSSTPRGASFIHGYWLAGNSSSKTTTLSPDFQSKPRAMVAMPSEVFFTIAISPGAA
jgi:hypothetical protein